jgi:hypothetical protein
MDDLTNYMGYRNYVLNGKIEECITAFRRGESEVQLDVSGLAANEVIYIYNEVNRRINTRQY